MKRTGPVEHPSETSTDAALLPFADGGEMAEVMAQWDWGSTPVGPPSEWPLALRIVVRLLLTSRFAMWAGWGPDLAFFYNDSYRRDTLGIKHPWALGRPAREVWAEIWDDIGPRIRQVLESGTATWDEALMLFLERSGYREETYHTFSYSPLASEDGGEVAGLLCVVTEETNRVIGERRMATLRDLAADLSGRHSEDDVLEAVAGRLAENPKDLPFALVFLDGDDPDARRDAWPIDEVISEGTTRLVDDLGDRAGDLPRGAWDDPPERAAVVPLAQRGVARPIGALVVGLNPYRPADDAYLSFLELLADQIAAGIAGARAYEAERRRAESLAELDRAKTEFFSNVSHEFRTPLTLIAGPVEDSLADDLDPLSDSHRERLELVRRNTGRLRRLVNNMLDFARIEAGRMTAERVATDLAEVTHDLVSSFAPAIDRAGLRLHIDCPPLSRPVYVDRDMWEKIVLNLLSNALKFTLDGEIRVSLIEESAGPVLTVVDTGVGIPEDQVPHLFDRFHRVTGTDARSYEGTGIGLALVQQLVQLHDGNVEAQSSVAHGTSFTVRLPFGTSTTSAGDRQYESSLPAFLDEALQWSDDGAGAEAGMQAPADAATVLVVDDNPDLRNYISRLLEPFWHVLVASDGQHALDLLAHTTPDLVLSDVMMPGIDGFALLRAMRQDARTATVPMILLSARAGEEATIEGLDAGADDYLVKPFSSLELVARVRSAIELGRLRNREATWRTELVRHLDEGILVADTNGTVLEVNDTFVRLLGFDQAGAPYSAPYPWWPDADEHPSERAALEDAFAEAVTNGEFRGVLPYRHRDGRIVPCEASVSSIFDGGDRMFVITVRDLTEQLRAAARQDAVTQFAIELAEASDVESVLEAGLGELLTAFEATRVVTAAVTRAGEPVAASAPSGATWDEQEENLRALLAGIEQRDGIVATASPPGVGVAAGTGERRVSIWMELEDHRVLSADERTLLAVLAGNLDQAVGRAMLFEEQRAIATAMQHAILGPADVRPGIAVRYSPAEAPLQVGGDWYDVIDLGGGRVGLVVGDCVGHGLDAATVMGQLRSAARALLLQLGSPSDVIGALDAFAGRIDGARCTTMVCAVIEGDTVRYSCAGHVPALVVHADGRHEFLDDARSVPLASISPASRPEATTSLGPDSVLVFYTDGLVERRRESVDLGLDRLRASVVANRGLAEDVLIEHVMDDLLPGGRHADDVAMVVYRHAPVTARPFVTSGSGDPADLRSLRHALGQWLLDTGLDRATTSDVLIASGEAFANAGEHAYGFDPARSFDVVATIEDHEVRVVVADSGRWKPPGDKGDRGRGIMLMRGLMDGMTIEHGEGGTTVELTKKVPDVR